MIFVVHAGLLLISGGKEFMSLSKDHSLS